MMRLGCLFAVLAACTNAPAPKSEPALGQPTMAATPVPAPGPDAQKLFEEALALRTNGDDGAAKDKLDLAIEASPAFALARLERADVLLALGGDGAAILADAKAAVDALPQNPRAQKTLAFALQETGDNDGALAAFERSLALRDDPSIRRKLAAVNARAGRKTVALGHWEALRDADPSDVGTHVELAQLYAELDRPGSAEQEFRAALALAPSNFALRRRFADWLEKQGKVRDAREERKRAEAADPTPTEQERRLRPLLPASR
jgi:tetratricopeptide (TPR) repeat protein